jgi:hypothetical protein
MHNIVDPQQTRLFDPFSNVLTEQTRKRLLDGWPGVFRHVILQLMPVKAVSEHFDAAMGRPTKELYSIAGLLLIKEFMNWTKQEALDAYSFNINIHYALNLEPIAHDLSMRSLERYISLFENNDIARAVMSDITAELVKLLDIKIDKQRLDSTHIFSDMAGFGRTRMMGVAVKRFLTQLKRHDEKSYMLLERNLRDRYAPGISRLFADNRTDDQSRRLLRGQVAEDMYSLIRLFSSCPAHAARSTFKLLEKMFYEQCEIQEQKVIIKDKPGGSVMQNTSDPEATCDGHKGPGYQCQVTETCSGDNEVQIITSAIAQTAVEPDALAVPQVIKTLKDADLVPSTMLADSHYCGDASVELASQNGIELVGPAPLTGVTKPQDINKLNIDDFDIDENTEEIICCPAGHKPLSSVHYPQWGKTKTIMPVWACGNCEFLKECPVEKNGPHCRIEHTPKHHRSAARRREENTQAFRERYSLRAGIESTFSALKRRTGIGRLRVRGRPGVFNAIYLKIAGYNILRAACCALMHTIVHYRAKIVLCKLYSMLLAAIRRTKQANIPLINAFYPHKQLCLSLCPNAMPYF